SLGPAARRAIFERDAWLCAYCRRTCTLAGPRKTDPWRPTDAVVDHIIPLKLGGADEPSNYITACWQCNRDKWHRLWTPHGWTAEDVAALAGVDVWKVSP